MSVGSSLSLSVLLLSITSCQLVYPCLCYHNIMSVGLSQSLLLLSITSCQLVPPFLVVVIVIHKIMLMHIPVFLIIFVVHKPMSVLFFSVFHIVIVIQKNSVSVADLFVIVYCCHA